LTGHLFGIQIYTVVVFVFEYFNSVWDFSNELLQTSRTTSLEILSDVKKMTNGPGKSTCLFMKYREKQGWELPGMG
jgi:hypothetical protein